MGSPDISELLRSAAPTPTTMLDTSAIEQRAHRRRRRRHGAISGVSVLVIGVVIGLVALLPGPGGRQRVVAGPPARPLPMTVGGGTTTVELGLLDGTRLRLMVPDVGGAIRGATLSDLQLRGSVYVDGPTGRGWRLEASIGSVERLVPGGERVPVPTSSGASAASADRAGHRLGLQFGAWAVVVSGDSLTDAEIGAVLAGASFAQTADGGLEYGGSLPLWVVDSPDVSLAGRNVTISATIRDCAGQAGQPTAGGLTVTRFGEPARAGNLTVLCDPAAMVEISLDTSRPLTGHELDRVNVDVLSIGPTLAAIRRGQHP